MDALGQWLRWLLSLPSFVLEGNKSTGDNRQPQLSNQEAWPLVKASARWPEAYLALEPGLSYYQHQDDIMAYQTQGQTAFGVGGVNSDASDFLSGFRDHTSRAGFRRQLCFPLRQQERPLAAAASFESVQVGVEGWLELTQFSLRGRRFEMVRNMCNRAVRHGVRVEEVSDLALVKDELHMMHQAWLAQKRPSWRMRLLVGSPALEHPFDRRYFVARTQGRVEAFVTVLPGRTGECGIDVMCRWPDAVAGSMELLIREVALAMAKESHTRMSLGPCPMAGVRLDGQHQILLRIFRLLYDSSWGNALFGFRNLYRFKQKFHPTWEPVYFASAPSIGVLPLYLGCRMWGLY